MTFRLRTTSLKSLLGLRIDDERNNGTCAPGVIVMFGEEGMRLVGTADAGIDDVPVHDEVAPSTEHA